MKKILSVILSLALIFSALSVLGSIGFTASAANTDNLLPNPNWDYTYDESTGKYSIENWLLPSKGDVSVYTDEEGSTVVNITTADNNISNVDFRSNKSMSLSRTSYYKFSIMYKLEDSPSGSYYTSGSGVWFAFRHNNQSANRKSLEKTSVWTEASFIIYGGNMSASSLWDVFFTIVSDCTRCSLSVKNPSVTLLNPDDLDYKRDTVTENLLTNGDFSSYDAETYDVENLVIEGKTYPWYGGHTVETVDVNGTQMNALKLTVNSENNNRRVRMNFDYSKMSKDKSYKFSAWIKLENNSNTGSFTSDAKIGAVRACFHHGNQNNFGKTRYQEKNGWQKIEFIIDPSVHGGIDWWQDNTNRFGVGIDTYHMVCDIYLADMKLQENTGNITVENAANMFTNGDLSQYDEEANEFANLNINNQDMPWYGGHSRETVTLNGKETNALKLTVNPENNTRRIKMAIHGNNIKKTAKYKFSLWVRLENNSLTGTFSNNSKFGNVALYFHHGTTNSAATQTVQTKDGWQKMEFVLDESVHGNKTWWDLHEFGFGLSFYSMTCDVYIADFRLEELAGGDEERSGGYIQVNRKNAVGGDQVQVKVDVDEGFTLKRLYYTDGVDETLITENRTTISATPTYNGITFNTTTYTSLASDKVYVFDMPSSKDITVMADYYYYLYGDINGDREFNAIDVVALKKFVAGLGVEIVPENLDSLEENINIYHVAALRNIFLGNEVDSDVAVANVDSLTTLTPNFQ